MCIRDRAMTTNMTAVTAMSIDTIMNMVTNIVTTTITSMTTIMDLSLIHIFGSGGFLRDDRTADGRGSFGHRDHADDLGAGGGF